MDLDAVEGVAREFAFDASYAGCIEYRIDTDKTVFVLPVRATELVRLSGIDDTTLFSKNVRLGLGSTAVNRAIGSSVKNSAEHKYFPLYHNGVTLICGGAELQGDKLCIRDYVVVNGAQSITTFHRQKKSLSDDLRIFVKVIALQDSALARRITINSNNQNAIKPRDLRSNHDLMLRLKAEFDSVSRDYVLEIKRGEEFPEDKVVISNEEAGRLLLTFDLDEPYACHQIYKLFDDKYSNVFGRPEVDAHRIIFLYRLLEATTKEMAEIRNAQMANYRLTRYFVVNVIGHILKMFEPTKRLIARKNLLAKAANVNAVLHHIPELLGSLIVDLNYEVESAGELFDYKKDLKSPERVKHWRERLLKSFEKDVRRGKAVDFSKIAIA